jgi:chitinase
MRRFSIVLCALTLVIASSTAVSAEPPQSGPPGQLSRGDSEIVGYYISWGVYGRQFFVRDLIDNGSAEKLTVINYAFANAVPDENGDVVCVLGDEWADYQMPIAAENSVSGEEVTWPQPILGNFHELRALKELYPNVRIHISIGGWTWSQYFSDAALTAESREAFVESCVELFIKGDLPDPGWGGMGGPGAAAGVFDGIDLDWEWPGSPGHEHNIVRPEDKENFTALVAEFREQLDDYGEEVEKDYQLTAFLPAAPSAIAAGFEVPELMQLFDFATFQGYDLAGSWDLSATNHHSKLYAPMDDPEPQFSVDVTVRTLLAAGAPADKLVMGVPFYGRGWTGVTDEDGGLYQPAAAPAPGTWEAGVEDYHVLSTLPAEGFQRYWDAHAKVPWLFDGSTFWTYDDPQSLKHKTRYVRLHGLAGVMFWELTGDTSNGELISAIHKGLTGRGPH